MISISKSNSTRVNLLPHTDDLTAELLSLTTLQLNLKQQCYLAALVSIADKSSYVIHAYKLTLLHRFNACLCQLNSKPVSMRTMDRTRDSLAEYLIVIPTKHQATQIIIKLDAIQANLKRLWRKVITMAKKRYFAHVNNGARKQKETKTAVDSVLARNTAQKTASNNGALNQEITHKNKDKYIYKFSSDFIEKMYVNKELKAKLYAGDAVPQEVTHARKIYQFHQWQWPFYQYDHLGRFQLTGKAASEAIQQRIDEHHQHLELDQTVKPLVDIDELIMIRHANQLFRAKSALLE